MTPPEPDRPGSSRNRYGLKVGVTVVATTGEALQAALWSSGVVQNIVFLTRLLQRLPQVETAALVVCPAGAADHAIARSFGFTAMDLDDAVASLDVIIELGARIEPEAAARFRQRGGRLVSYVAGNVLAMNFEALACGVPHGELLSPAGFDAVWITPQHWRMNQSYARMTRTPAVELAPHIWSPEVLMRSADQEGGARFWKPTEEPARLGVFDPNVNVVKTFHLPLLVCEEAYRRRPDVIDRVLLFSADHLKGVPHVEELCATTDLARDKRLFLESRFPLAAMLGRHVDAVVTHQWENALNYLYWDVLYLGFPLVHNAQPLCEVGYFYPDFDPQTGAGMLIEALTRHKELRNGGDTAVRAQLWSRHVDNPENQHAYGDLLDKVMG